MARQLVPIKRVPEERPHYTLRHLRRLVSEHRVAYFKIDGKIFFALDDLDQHDEAGRVEAR